MFVTISQSVRFKGREELSEQRNIQKTTVII